MVTEFEKDKIHELILKYDANERNVSVKALKDFGQSLTPSSPKTGKPVTFGTMCQYVIRKIPSHCTKYDLLRVLAYIYVNDKVVPEKTERGFFSA